LYYDNLSAVREKNDLAQWLRFFLTGVIQTAEESVSTLKKIVDLKATIEKDRVLAMGKRSKQGVVLLHYLFKKPVVSVKDVQAATGLSPKAANDLVQAFVEKNILIETTGQRRNRTFTFGEYMRLF
jgi:Fic family protein